MKEFEEKVYDTIYKQLKHGMLSHAYLIETGDYDNIDFLIHKTIKTILCPQEGIHNNSEQCNICHLIDSNHCGDLKFVYPEGTVIKKEQLLEVKKLFKTTSNSKYRIYIIYDADKLNSSSANTILKFLEEPESGVIAFLIAKNRYQVLETLVSRCQILSIRNNSNENLDDNTLKFIQLITTNSDFYLNFKDILENYMSDKNTARIVLDKMESFFHRLLLSKIDDTFQIANQELFTNVSKDSIIKYILILEEEKQKLFYNINYRLWLDHLLIRFLEVISC